MSGRALEQGGQRARVLDAREIHAERRHAAEVDAASGGDTGTAGVATTPKSCRSASVSAETAGAGAGIGGRRFRLLALAPGREQKNQPQRRDTRGDGQRERLLPPEAADIGVARRQLGGDGALDGVARLLREIETVGEHQVRRERQLAAARIVTRALVHLLEILQRPHRIVHRGDGFGRRGQRLQAGEPGVEILHDRGHAGEPEVLALSDGDVRLLRGAQLGDADGGRASWHRIAGKKCR